MDGWLWRAPISACAPLVADDAAARWRRLVGRAGWAPLPSGAWLGDVAQRLALELAVTDEGHQVPWARATDVPRAGAALPALDGDAWRYLFVAGAVGDGAFSWDALCARVHAELAVPLGALVDDTVAALVAHGIPAGWRRSERAAPLIERADDAAFDAHEAAAAGRLDDALAILLAAVRALADRVEPGAAAAAAREACRVLLPVIGCVLPATAARAWRLLGLRGAIGPSPGRGVLIDEPMPAPPDGPLFDAVPTADDARAVSDRIVVTA